MMEGADHPASLATELRLAGCVLFRWRSYLPLALVPLMLVAVVEAALARPSMRLHWGYETLGLLLSLGGLVLRVFTVGTAPRGTSGRNTRAQKASVLNTTGPYSVVRHPLYGANGLVAIGLAAYTGHAWFALTVACATALYYERIVMAEEAYLAERFGADFQEWATRVPAALPRLSGYVPAALPFSWRTALRREVYGVAVVGTAVLGIEIVKHSVQAGRFEINGFALAVFALAMAVFVPVRVVKKWGGRSSGG